MHIRLQLSLEKIFKMIKKVSLYSIVIFSFLLILTFVFFSYNFCQADQAKSPVGMEWKTSVKGRTYSPLVAKNVSVYMGTDEGILYVFKGQDGSLKWRYKVGEKLRLTPVVEAGQVFLGAKNGNLYVLDAFTGSFLWSYQSGISFNRFLAGPSYNYVSLPAVSDGKVFHAAGGRVNAFDAEYGHILWSFDTDSTFSSSPVVDKKRIYFGSGEGKLYALEGESGSKLWEFETGSSIDTSPAAASGRVFQGVSSGILYALDGKSGELLWSYKSEGISFLKATGKVVYLCSNNGNLYAFKASSGRLLWRFDSEGSIIFPPTVSRNMLYLGSNDGRFYALDAKDGTVRWVYETGGFLATSPVEAGKTIYGTSSRRTTKGPIIQVVAFKKGSFQGKQILIRGATENFTFTEMSRYLSTLAKNTFGSEGRETDMLTVAEASGWPIDIFLEVLKGSEEKTATGFLIDLLDSSPYFSAVGFWYSLLFSPWILMPVAQLVLIIFLILAGMSLASPVSRIGFGGAIFSSGQRGPGADKRRKIVKTISCLKEALELGFADYPLFLANFVTLTIMLSIVYLLFSRLATSFDLTYLLVFITFLWLLAWLVGTAIRGLSLMLIVSRKENLRTRFKKSLQKLKESYLRLLKVSCLYGFLFLLLLLNFGLALAYNLVVLKVLIVLVAAASSLILFADALTVLDGCGLKEAISGSVSFVLSNPLAVLFYLLLLQAIFLATVGLSLYLLTTSWGFAIFLVLCSILAGVLNHFHGVVHRALK